MKLCCLATAVNFHFNLPLGCHSAVQNRKQYATLFRNVATVFSILHGSTGRRICTSIDKAGLELYVVVCGKRQRM